MTDRLWYGLAVGLALFVAGGYLMWHSRSEKTRDMRGLFMGIGLIKFIYGMMLLEIVALIYYQK